MECYEIVGVPPKNHNASVFFVQNHMKHSTVYVTS